MTSQPRSYVMRENEYRYIISDSYGVFLNDCDTVSWGKSCSICCTYTLKIAPSCHGWGIKTADVDVIRKI